MSDTHFLPRSTDVIDDILIPSTCAAAYLRNVFTDSVLLENYRTEHAQDHEDGNTIKKKKTWRTVTFQFRDINTVFPCTMNVHAVSNQRRPCTQTCLYFSLWGTVKGALRVPQMPAALHTNQHHFKTQDWPIYNEGKVLPVNIMKVYTGRGGTTPLILNLGTRCRSAIHFAEIWRQRYSNSCTGMAGPWGFQETEEG